MISAFCRSFSDAVVARKCRFISQFIRPCVNLAGKDKSHTSSPQWTDNGTFLPPSLRVHSALSLRGRKQELGSRLIRTRDHPTDRRPRQTAMVISRDSLSRRRKSGEWRRIDPTPIKKICEGEEGARSQGRKGIIIGSQAAARVVNRDRSLKRHLHHLIHIVDRSFRYGRR